MATKLLSITPRTDGGRDVIFDDDTGRYACQIYDTTAYPQRFTWAELDAALARRTFPNPDKLPPPPDTRTPEERASERIAEIKSLLISLDREVSRISEDLAGAVKKLEPTFALYPTKQAVIDKKVALRAELAGLMTP